MSFVERIWARAFKFHTNINQGLKSCCVKVRLVANCRFWSLWKVEHFIFSWGNVGENIRYHHLNICVWGRKLLYALALLVAKHQINLIKVLYRSVSHLFPRIFFNDRTSCVWIKLELYYSYSHTLKFCLVSVLCRSTTIIRNDRIYLRNQARARWVWWRKMVEITAVSTA